MNVVDSSGWLEYYSDGPNADFFAPAIEALETLVVPTIILYEVFKHVLRHRGETEALIAVAHMRQGTTIDLDPTLSLNAARISATLKLPMADSIILATARQADAIVWTQDKDFEGLQGVRYRAKS